MVSLKAPLGATANLNEALWPGKTVADCAEPVANPKSSTNCVSAGASLLKKPPLPL